MDKDYSDTPLYKKLGLKSGSRFAVVNEPDGFLASFDVPDDVEVFERASQPLDIMLFFSESRSHLHRRFESLKQFLADDGGFWVAYPKKSSKLKTDLDFDFVQAEGLSAGLVDNKSCAIDDDWSAVRFVYRLADRGSKRSRR